MKLTHKDARKTIRINSEILEEMENEANNQNISFSDYVVHLYKESKERLSLQDVQTRLEKLEKKFDAA